VRVGIGDDCALLRARAGEELAVTTDLSIDGRHFRLEWHSPEVVGHRTLARGLSDLAAMGARPVAAFLSLGLPPELIRNRWPQHPWIGRFYDGLLKLAAEYKTPLAGGDLAESPVAVADIVLIGAVPRGRAMLRSGARAGDRIYATGALGGAAAGLARIAELAAEAGPATVKRPLRIPARLRAALEPHFNPRPRVAQGLWLVRNRVATAGLDLSDGLSTDLNHLCEESGVAAEVNAAAVPVYRYTAAGGATLEQALHGGEDYELLFTAGPKTRVPRSIAGVQVTEIGRVVRRRAGRPLVTLITASGARPLEPRGWEHFS
jgi:thiamine-monophosphate kinase